MYCQEWGKRSGLVCDSFLKSHPVLHRILMFMTCFVLVSCGQDNRLAETPNVLLPVAQYPDKNLPNALKTTQPTIYYMTDREPSENIKAKVPYSHERSASMALGRQKLQFGEDLDWGELRLLSVLRHKTVVPVRAIASDELVRFPPTPIPFVSKGGRTIPDPVIARSYATAEDAFRREIRQALRITPDGEVLVYIHGVNNDFSRGAGTIANLWHFSGRQAVPIVYTWPAATPGLVGYFSDRESSIFSIFHFKQFLTLLAKMPEVKKINIVAHSQGTALTTSALRELIIAERAAGRNPKRSLKIETLILAAPDLNYEVFGQRFLAERFNDAFKQVTIYTSSNDYALGIAQFLFRGVRVGRVTYDDLDSIERRVLEGAPNIHIINVEAVVGRDSHSYFHNNPDVLSDIVISLRTGLPPGGEERPLEFQKGNFWNLHAGYPFDRPKTVFELERPDP